MARLQIYNPTDRALVTLADAALAVAVPATPGLEEVRLAGVIGEAERAGHHSLPSAASRRAFGKSALTSASAGSMAGDGEFLIS